MKKAIENNLIQFDFCNPRHKTTDRHQTVDDRPYGGGPGMVMLLEPLAQTLNELGYTPEAPRRTHPALPRLIMLNPKGKPFTQAMARELAAEQHITLMCGRYEGIDARLEQLYPIENVSLGDFILNGGEVAALSIVESVSRLVPGFMGHAESGTEESFSQGLLEYPQYTRPEAYESLTVPEILRSGDHGRIARWRRQQALEATLHHRPELLSDARLSADDQQYLRSIPYPRPGKNLYCALVHHPVLNKDKKSATVSLTNLDIHDIARSSCTYGLGGYYITTPLEDQSRLLSTIVEHWTAGAGSRSNPDRATALRMVRHAALVEDAVRDIQTRTGQMPLLVSTSAQGEGSMPAAVLRQIVHDRPVLLIFGTGQGLAPELTALCDAMLAPIRWHGEYNHLSVRSAVAITLDRILGDWY